MTNNIADKIVTAIFVGVFAIMWFCSTRYYEKPKQYLIIVYDVFGCQIFLEGLRTNFRTIEVATSYIKDYQETFPQYSFSLESFLPEIKRKTILELILKK